MWVDADRHKDRLEGKGSARTFFCSNCADHEHAGPKGDEDEQAEHVTAFALHYNTLSDETDRVGTCTSVLLRASPNSSHAYLLFTLLIFSAAYHATQ